MRPLPQPSHRRISSPWQLFHIRAVLSRRSSRVSMRCSPAAPAVKREAEETGAADSDDHLHHAPGRRRFRCHRSQYRTQEIQDAQGGEGLVRTKVWAMTDKAHIQASSDKNTHIREFLSRYVELPYSPYYAVILTGPWGIGKTFLVKEFLRKQFGDDREHNDKKCIYVSLYGLTSIDEIDAA